MRRSPISTNPVSTTGLRDVCSVIRLPSQRPADASTTSAPCHRESTHGGASLAWLDEAEELLCEGGSLAGVREGGAHRPDRVAMVGDVKRAQLCGDGLPGDGLRH